MGLLDVYTWTGKSPQGEDVVVKAYCDQQRVRGIIRKAVAPDGEEIVAVLTFSSDGAGSYMEMALDREKAEAEGYDVPDDLMDVKIEDFSMDEMDASADDYDSGDFQESYGNENDGGFESGDPFGERKPGYPDNAQEEDAGAPPPPTRDNGDHDIMNF